LTLAEAGSEIVAVSRTLEELERTANGVNQLGRKCLAISTDVSDISQVKTLVENVISELGKVDILVNNAASIFFKPLVPTPGLNKLPIARILPDLNVPITDEEWNTIWDTNVKGVFNCIRVVVPFMAKERKGKIINVISGASVKYTAFMGIYPATKAAVAAITRCLANELARFNINVNAIGPGIFPTAMMEKLLSDEETKARLLRTIPLRRFGNLREVGLLTVYLASDASAYMTGQSLYIDGGYTIA
jgi:NAD(P)-dependent dehydrogenase (short-subunit alcohol dehydrogenase family)